MNLLPRLPRRPAPTAPVRTPDEPSEFGQYEACMDRLTTLTDSDDRAECLEFAASWADSFAFWIDDEAASAEWTAIALLLRAAAATERGLVLTHPAGTGGPLNGHPVLWGSLAVTHEDRARRAGYLRDLAAAIAPQAPPGAADVLVRVAATEATESAAAS